MDPDALMASEEIVSSGDPFEDALLAYLKATDTVLVPREATEETIKAIKGWPHSYVHGPRSFYRAMIQAAEGK